jgi:predicted phosphate transport protein (TIGR00153 family)
MRLLPREEKFFQFFLRQADLISQASALLKDGVRENGAFLVQASIKIAELERQGDEVTHELFTGLNQTFITPLDPEDINAVGSHLDDILDELEEAAHRLVSYEIHEAPPPMIELCDIIHRCSAVLIRAMTDLSRGKPLLDHCIEINRLENEADRLHRAAISALFRNGGDPLTVMKFKEIYEHLEQTVDYYEDVADALQNVIVKNG